MKLLTVQEVCQIAGVDPKTNRNWVNPQTLRNWITAGLIEPAQPGKTGTGNGHRFSIVQAVALAAGAKYRAEGASPDRVAGVVKYLSGMQIEHLEAELAAGRTFPVPGALLGESWLPGTMIEPPSDPSLGAGAAALMRRLDLVPIYEEVKRKVAKLSSQPAKSRASTVDAGKVK